MKTKLINQGTVLPGIVILSLAYPVYARITARERITPEILRLTDELMK